MEQIRLIRQGMHDAFTNMAIDEALTFYVYKTKIPVLRLGYRWQEPGGVSLGLNQNTKDVNIDYCLQQGIPVVRRPTGGMALYHSPRDFTYAAIYPKTAKTLFDKTFYRQICARKFQGMHKTRHLMQFCNMEAFSMTFLLID